MNYTDKIRKLRELAATRRHKIDLSQLDGTRRLSDAQMDGMKRYLDRCPPLANPLLVSRETPVSAAPAATTPARPGFRPGTRVSEPGMYYNRGRVFKVYQSVYGNQGLRAKVFSPSEINPRTSMAGAWTAFPAALGFLRAEDEMTPADSIEFEKKYGFAFCTKCGLPLENDLSRELRIGPTCRSK